MCIISGLLYSRNVMVARKGNLSEVLIGGRDDRARGLTEYSLLCAEIFKSAKKARLLPAWHGLSGATEAHRALKKSRRV